MTLGELSAQRVANLSTRLYRALCEADIRAPTATESEPQFTKGVLAPVVREVLADLPALRFQFRGDGGSSQAVPASALDIPFFPDLAVSFGKQHLWAAEVKVLRRSSRQSAIATALGQATLYRSRYRHVVVVLIDTMPSSTSSQRQLVEAAAEFGIHIVIRPRIGGVLLTQQVT